VKEERIQASKILNGPAPAFSGNRPEFINNLRDALYASRSFHMPRVMH